MLLVALTALCSLGFKNNAIVPTPAIHQLHHNPSPLIGRLWVSVVKMNVHHFTKGFTILVPPSIDTMALPTLVHLHLCHSPIPPQSKTADWLVSGVCCDDECRFLHQSLHDTRLSFNRHNAVACASSPLPFTNRHLIADKPQPTLPVHEFSNHQLFQPQSLIPTDLLFSHSFYQHSTETPEVPPTWPLHCSTTRCRRSLTTGSARHAARCTELTSTS